MKILFRNGAVLETDDEFESIKTRGAELLSVNWVHRGGDRGCLYFARIDEILAIVDERPPINSSAPPTQGDTLREEETEL